MGNFKKMFKSRMICALIIPVFLVTLCTSVMAEPVKATPADAPKTKQPLTDEEAGALTALEASSADLLKQKAGMKADSGRLSEKESQELAKASKVQVELLDLKAGQGPPIPFASPMRSPRSRVFRIILLAVILPVVVVGGLALAFLLAWDDID